jgi:ABC-type metal ion transport system, periplasmic component/surface adhesin
MKKLIPILLSLLILASCAPQAQETPTPAPSPTPQMVQTETPAVLNIVATSYPVYMLTKELAKGTEHTVTLLVKDSVSCLHDYMLTTSDMKLLESADVLVMNGAGLEDFMSSAIASVGNKLAVIDSSAYFGVSFVEEDDHAHEDEHDHSHDHDDHDHSHDYAFDPHFWMDLSYYFVMGDEITYSLQILDEENAAIYEENLYQIYTQMVAVDEQMLQMAEKSREIITFHDGFFWLAFRYNLTILRSIEEEAGSEASAKDIAEIISLVREHELEAIYVERFGSTATAEAIARETGVEVRTLDMCMSGEEDESFGDYLERIKQNLAIITGDVTE